MIVRKAEDGWLEFFREQEDTAPIFRCKPPKDFNVADVDRIREHLLKVVREQKVGPS